MKSLSQEQVVEFSTILNQARKSSSEIEPLTKSFTDFSLADAYRIQADGINRRLGDSEKTIGYKMGLTSKAKMEQMGLDKPIYGVLTDKMQIENKSDFSMQDKIHPKAEPEIFFVTNRELKGALAPEDALAACSKIGVALEILDSRYKGFKYFTLPDVVADNSSSAYFVLGESISPQENTQFAHPEIAHPEIANLEIEIRENDTVIHSALSSAIMGNPLLSLCELVKLLSENNLSLPAGSIVLAGAATAAIELKAGQKISARLASVGSVEFNVV